MKNTSIFDLLEKETLTLEEKQELDKLCSEDPEANKISQVYRSVKNIVEKGAHIDSYIISEYTLIKNGIVNENKWLLKLIPKIESHLRKCELCKNNFTMMNEEYSNVEKFVSESLSFEEQKLNNTDNKENSWWHLRMQSSLRKTAYAIIAICLVYFSIFSFYSLTTPTYKKGLTVFKGNQELITRGRISSKYQKGIAELNKKNFDEAIKNFTADIQSNPNDKTIFYTYFILGKIYLETSKKNVLGLYNDYDKLKLEQSINAFKKMIKKNKNIEFKHLNNDAYYFIARALLLLDRNDEAKKYFNIVINNNGSFKKEAENLLNELKANEK